MQPSDYAFAFVAVVLTALWARERLPRRLGTRCKGCEWVATGKRGRVCLRCLKRGKRRPV